MKTSPEHEELLHDVLFGARSQELSVMSLDRTLQAVRRQRRRRYALRGAGGVVTMGMLAAILWHGQTPAPQPSAVRSVPPALKTVAQTVPGTNIRQVGGEELLAMFPGRPVALVGPPENRQFVFLDELRASKTHPRPRTKGLNL